MIDSRRKVVWCAAARIGGSPAAAVALACLLLTTACVSSGKYDLALQEKADLAEQRRMEQEQFRLEKEALEEEIADRRAQITALGAEKTRMQEQIEQMDAELENLGARLDRHKAELAEQQQETARVKSTYEGLVSNLKNELASGQIEIRQLRDGLSVDVAQEILFPSGSARLDSSGQEVLRRVSDQLKKTPYEIIVGGHTDDVPIGPGLIDRYPSNWELAAARACSVVRLFEDAGVDVRRLRAVSFGEYHPRDSNETPEGRKRNRRIEIRMRPVVTEDEPSGRG